MAIKYLLVVNMQGQTRVAKYCDHTFSGEEVRAARGKGRGPGTVTWAGCAVGWDDDAVPPGTEPLGRLLSGDRRGGTGAHSGAGSGVETEEGFISRAVRPLPGRLRVSC